MFRILILLLVRLALALVASPLAHAWGERGHDIVTRVAAAKLEAISGAGPELSHAFKERDHMLSHLSNVPDFHWRSDYFDETQRDANYYTHFINLEHLYQKPQTIDDIELQVSQFLRKAQNQKIESPYTIGTAPWRVKQLFHQMRVAFERAKLASQNDDESARETYTAAVNQALLAAGLMSHFVADLANPHHTSTNHDGQLTGNTGLHAYFESAVVAELPLSLAADVGAHVSVARLNKMLSVHGAERAKAIMKDPLQLVFALVLDSHQQLDFLHQLDNRHAVLQASNDEDFDALRKPAAQSMPEFKEFAVQRMATGSAVLARLWFLAWQAGGSPDLSSYHSYHYWVAPDFIEPDYLSPSL